MIEIARKEINGFLSSLTAYIVILIFLLASGLILWILPGQNNILDNGQASMELFFIISPWVFLFLVPAVSMRLIAEEKRTGTIEFLLTKPISDWQFLGGKFLAGLLLVLLSILPTFSYVFTVYHLGDPVGIMDTGATIGSYIGLIFLAAVYVSIGIFSSSLTENQVVAFLIAIILSLLMYLGFGAFADFFKSGNWANFLTNLGIEKHYLSISRGLIDSQDIFYFLSIIAFYLMATKLVLESRKWK